MLIARIDAAGRYVYANGAYAERHGADPAAIVGRTVREVVGDGVHAAIEPHLTAALGGARVEIEELIAFPIGEPVTARCIYEPERDASGRIAGAITVLDQLTDGGGKLLQQELAAREEQLRTLTDELSRLAHLRDVSHVTTGRLELQRQHTDVALIVQAAIEATRPLLAARGLRLEVALPAELLHVDADEVRLARAFTNLLDNSARYTEPGGRVSIAAQRNGDADEVEVIVRDDGRGIAPDVLPLVFDLFVQGDHPVDGNGPIGRHAGGHGIGLTLVRQLVELHGGTVAANSDGDGRGTEMRVRLPLAGTAAIAPATAAVAAAAPEPERRAGLRVLVADDNSDNVETLAMMLELHGHEVATARDGIEALAAAQRFRPQVALLDLGMPAMNGYELCRALRALPFGSDVCVVAITGWGQDEDRRRTGESGFDHHLVKPVDFADIARLLEGYARPAF